MKIYWNLLILCIIESSQTKSSHIYTNDYESSEGDMIIKKILSAGSFDELANKIVDKAIWKLAHQNSNLPISKIVNPDPEFKSVVDNTAKVRLNKNVHKHHKSAVNVDAVLKNKVLPLSDLSLRYERFTKNHGDFNSPEAGSLNKINDFSNENKIELSNKIQDKNVFDAQSNNYEGGKNRSEETVTSYKKIYSEMSSAVSNFPTNLETTSKKESMENLFGIEKTIIWDAKDESGDRNNSDESDEAEIRATHLQKVSSESVKTHYARENDAKEPSTLNEETLQKTSEANKFQLKHEEIKNKSKLLRKEGNKIFVFEESPDYQEYHENLAQMRNMHKNNE